MSHPFMPVRKPPFEKILCYNLSAASLEKLKAIREENLFPPEVGWIYVNSRESMAERFESESLILTEGKHSYDFLNTIFHLGATKHMDVERFLRDRFDMAHAGRLVSFASVVLAFMHPVLERMLTSLFRTAGFLVYPAHSLSELQKYLKDEKGYVVLDVDFSGAGVSASRLPILRAAVNKHLSWAKKQFSKVSVTAIKDFSQGSLFDDISSSVKEFSNLMLSPSEYILFLRDYLFQIQAEKIEADYAHYFKEGGRNPREAHLLEPGIYMRNMQTAFGNTKENPFIRHKQAWEHYQKELHYLSLRNRLSDWMGELLLNHKTAEEGFERGSFQFLSSVEAPPNQLIQKEVPASIVMTSKEKSSAKLSSYRYTQRDLPRE